MPAFPALAAFIASIVGYPMPVLCQPLPEGTAISYQISAPQFGSLTVNTQPLPANLAGVTVTLGAPVGWALTITVGGQTVTLPPIPASTPVTALEPSHPAGYVYIPIFIALINCDGWTSADPTQRGQTLLTAIHEAMHAKYADGDEALTECRALQALPAHLSALWPGAYDPGAAPPEPVLPVRDARWRKSHPAAWLRLLTAYRHRYLQWQPVEAHWATASSTWGSYEAIINAALQMDAGEPAQYHGATC